MASELLNTITDITGLAGRVVKRTLGVYGASSATTLAYVATAAPRRFELRHGTRWTRRWARSLCWGFDLAVHVTGRRPTEGSLIVSNHRSYLDIAALGSQVPGCFVARSDIVDWPVLGVTFRVSPTLFVDRSDPDSRHKVREQVMERLRLGASVFNFAEGTTHASTGLLPFKMGLFKDLFGLDIPVVPTTVTYARARDRVEYVGDDTFFSHFVTLAGHEGMEAHVHFGEPVRAAGFDNLEEMVLEIRRRMLTDLATREEIDPADYPELRG